MSRLSDQRSLRAAQVQALQSLEDQLLSAHRIEDKAALVRLYTAAADASTHEEAAGFYLTHAYIFALETGAPEAQTLRHRLCAMGREEAPVSAQHNPLKDKVRGQEL